MLPNLLQYPVAMFGVLRAGLAVNVNPLSTPRELEYQLRDRGARAIVLLDGLFQAHQSLLVGAELKAVITTSMAGASILPEHLNDVEITGAASVNVATGLNAIDLRPALAMGTRHPFPWVALTHADNAFLQYTGGTTGLSKGAQLTHGTITANVMQIGPWMLDPGNGMRRPHRHSVSKRGNLRERPPAVARAQRAGRAGQAGRSDHRAS